MITRKDFGLVMLTVSFTFGAMVLAQNARPAMGSQVIDWEATSAKPNRTGSSRKFFESSTATLDLLECHVSTLNPGLTNHPPQRKPQEEVIVVKEGEMEAFGNDGWKRVGPGSVIFNAFNGVQAMRNVGATPATYHVVTWHSARTPDRPDGK